MQTDVKSVHANGGTTGVAVSLLTGRFRVKSVIIAGGAGSGIVKLSDGTTSANSAVGITELELDTGANSNVVNVLLPGEGILFENGIWYTPTTVVPIGITVVYA
jgi:hypothetical protein